MKFIFSILSLLTGGLIYLGYRTETLLMFKWVDYLGLSPWVKQLRTFCTEFPLPSWVYYSLPDGLWLLSYMLFMNIIWSKKEEIQYIIWLYILPIIAIVSEILQIFISGIGTFDIIDLLSYVSAILTFNIFTQWNVKKKIGHCCY